MWANVIPLWGFVCTETCLHAEASALLIHHEKHPLLFTSGEDCHGGLSLTEAVNVFLRDHDLRVWNGDAATAVCICWRGMMFPWQFWHAVFILAKCLFTPESLRAPLFSKSHQPCVLVCVRKTKIKSPRCETYLHPWHLDMALGLSLSTVRLMSLWALSLVSSLGLLLRDSRGRNQALWAKRKTMAINTTECPVLL